MARSELARVAEQAFNESMDKGWDFRDVMQSVADAVMHESRTDGLEEATQDVLKSGERKLAERKVIEAARAWVELHYDTGVEFADEHEEQDFADKLGEANSRLWEAVEALEAEDE